MTLNDGRTASEPAGRKRREDGERSRSAILDAGARLATVEGITGLSIARLAEAVGMSKSGLYAHFGSKQELQLAVVRTARAIFDQRVTEPADLAASAMDRLRVLVDGFVGYLEAETFPGGCFFASVLAEVDTHPGPVRDELVAFLDDWLARLETTIREAQSEGALDPAEDPAQLAFEIQAALMLANAQLVISRRPEPLDRARTAIDGRLAAASAHG